MGGKKKKHSHKKWTSFSSIDSEKKIRTRKDQVLMLFSEPILQLWFGEDKEKRYKFAEYIIKQEDLSSEDSLDFLISSNKYDEKLKKLERHSCKNMDDCIDTVRKKSRLIEKAEKYRPKKVSDLNIATYLGKPKNNKKYLSSNEYRNELKSIVKREKDDIKLLKSIGYVRNEPDDELNRLKNANKLMETALSDAYIQKHFLD